MLETVFVMLYPLAAACHVMAYVPQIRALMKTTFDVTVMPVSPWMIWLFGNIVTLGYGAFHLKDLLLCLTVGLTTSMISVIIALILYNRRRYCVVMPMAAE